MSSQIDVLNPGVLERPKIFMPEKTASLAHSEWNLFLVGAGGTGSHAAGHISRMMATPGIFSSRIGSLTIIDGDHVEAKNVGRQNFTQKDVGKYKAERLARRYSVAFGISIRYVNKFLVKGFLGENGGIATGSLRTPTMFIGAVDDNKCRRLIYREIRKVAGQRRAVYWLDSGNGGTAGQVVWGNTADKNLISSGVGNQFVEFIPYPPMVYPELVEINNKNEPAPSCADAIVLEEQGPNINAQMGLLLAEMLRQLIVGELTTHTSVVNFDHIEIISQPITDAWLNQFGK